MSNEIEKKTPSENDKKMYQRPYYEVSKGDAAYNIQVYLPGATFENTSIMLEKNNLTIEAERHCHWEGRGRFLHREIADATYQLNLELNVPINSESVSANQKNGILNIHLPIAEEAKPLKITVE